MAATSRQFCFGDTKQAGSIGGDANWFAQSNDACPGPDNDSAQSGDISDSQSTWMQTTVEGPGTLKFWWKVSSQTGDTMVFVLDGQSQGSLSGSGGWTVGVNGGGKRGENGGKTGSRSELGIIRCPCRRYRRSYVSANR